MPAVAVAHAAAGRGIGILLSWLIHVVAWSLVFHLLGGFLYRYTHVPWLGTIAIVVVVIALLRLAARTWRRRQHRHWHW